MSVLITEQDRNFVSKFNRLIVFVNLLLPLAALAILWAPVYLIFQGPPQVPLFKPTPAVSDVPVEAQLGPLKMVTSGAPFFASEVAPQSFVQAADALLAGKIDFTALDANFSYPEQRSFRPPFDADLVNSGNSSWQLFYAGFGLPAVYLKAYQTSENLAYLEATRDFLLGWHQYEASQLTPGPFIWNDHAVASRGLLTADFWYQYRNSPLFNQDDAQAIIALARQTARLLAHERLYTYRTNHGTMQNTALAKLALTFPHVPEMSDYKALAFARMHEQLDFLFSEDGVVQEHSPGYHAFGIALLDDMVALLEADRQPVPGSLMTLRARAHAFLDHIARPDGSLPRIGDTHANDAALAGAGHSVSAPTHGAAKSALYGQSGFAVHEVMESRLASVPTQLAVFWGYVPYMGHIHANEMSLHLWAGGTDWWTASGYWPYSRDDRAEAICWSSSNAPHLLDEPCPPAERDTRVLGVAHASDTYALDLSRSTPDGFTARRQILSVTGDLVLTLDSFEDTSPRTAQIVWRSDPKSELAEHRNNFVRLQTAQQTVGLAAAFLSSAQAQIDAVHRDPDSTLGWVMDGAVRPAHTLVQTLPSNGSWALNVSAIEADRVPRFNGDAQMVSWSGPEDWHIRLMLDGQGMTIQRTGPELKIQHPQGQLAKRLTLSPAHDGAQGRERSLAAFQAVKQRYGTPFNPFTPYRVRLTWVLAALGAVHFAFLLGLKYCPRPIRTAGLWAPVIAWPLLMAWIMYFYLVQ